MNYQTKRVLGTLVATALILFVRALITGTAHASPTPAQPTKLSAFTNAQLFRALPQAQYLCLEESPDGYDCGVTNTIANELLARGAVKALDTPTIDKLHVIVIVNENCLQAHVCAYDQPLLINSLATALYANHVKPDDFMRTYEQWYGELHALGPIFAPVLDNVYMNAQRAKRDGL